MSKALVASLLSVLLANVYGWEHETEDEQRRLFGSYDDASYGSYEGSYGSDDGVDFASQLAFDFGSVDMGALDSTGRVSTVNQLNSQMMSSASSAADVSTTLSTLATLAGTSTGMDTATATAIVETLGTAISTSALAETTTGLTVEETKNAMKAVIQEAQATMIATTAKIADSMSPGDAPTILTDTGGDLKIQVSKVTPANLASSTQSIVSTAGNTITFQMPATLPSGITSESSVTLQAASRAVAYTDPDGELDFSVSDSVSLSFVDESGNELTGLDFSANPIQVELPLSTALSSPGCYYYDISQGDWSDVGLSVVSATGSKLTCETTHLTEFAGANAPTNAPTKAPTQVPTAPTAIPTTSPTADPTLGPTPSPTEAPTTSPTADPTLDPTPSPTEAPTASPSATPTPNPTPDDGSGGVGTRYPTPTPRGMYSSPGPEPTPSPPAPTAVPTAAPTDEVPYSHTTTFISKKECAAALSTKWLELDLKANCCDRGSGIQFCGDSLLDHPPLSYSRRWIDENSA